MAFGNVIKHGLFLLRSKLIDVCIDQQRIEFCESLCVQRARYVFAVSQLNAELFHRWTENAIQVRWTMVTLVSEKENL